MVEAGCIVVELRLLGVLEKNTVRLYSWVYCSRKIAVGSAGIPGSRAKVSGGCVMLVGSRKIAYRCVMIIIGCSVNHYGLFVKVVIPAAGQVLCR
ncbi:hypothetical protein [Dendrosporobacter sp. 1207_IL3150]|uniref:hypothetical protein n=1 Tax=Dendrosporobacter sp. 1207_IL3150 TaxID=3084054 RepID=UPI002FDB8300